MYTMTHMYFSYLFLPQNKDVTLGAIFPDTNIFSPLNHRQTHENTENLIKLAKKENPEMLQFAQSIYLHEKLDYLGDKNWEKSGLGYCFIEGKEIVEMVEEVFNTKDRSFSLFKAHNFIEMAIQLLVVESHPYLPALFKEAISDKKLIRDVSEFLADYYLLESEAIERSFLKYPSIVEYENINLKNMVIKSNLQTLIKNKTTIDVEQGITLIEKAMEVIKWEFFPNTIDEICIFNKCKELVKAEGIL